MTLSNRFALMIARSYRLDVSQPRVRNTVRVLLVQACENDGKHGKSAVRYFDDYVGEEARVCACETAEAVWIESNR